MRQKKRRKLGPPIHTILGIIYLKATDSPNRSFQDHSQIERLGTRLGIFFGQFLLQCSLLSKHNINTSSIEQYYKECKSLIHLKDLVIICKICISEEGSLGNRLSFQLCGQTHGYILHTRQPLSP